MIIGPKHCRRTPGGFEKIRRFSGASHVTGDLPLNVVQTIDLANLYRITNPCPRPHLPHTCQQIDSCAPHTYTDTSPISTTMSNQQVTPEGRFLCATALCRAVTDLLCDSPLGATILDFRSREELRPPYDRRSRCACEIIEARPYPHQAHLHRRLGLEEDHISCRARILRRDRSR